MDEKKIYGVTCDVDSCVYNESNHDCVAGQIKVDYNCSDENACSQTLCKTFKAK